MSKITREWLPGNLLRLTPAEDRPIPIYLKYNRPGHPHSFIVFSIFSLTHPVPC